MKVRKGGGEEIPLVQGKEQWLGFAGVALKRYPNAQGKRNPSKMVGVARGHQRVDTLKPYSQKTSQSNHTRTIAFSKSLGPMDILILIIQIHKHGMPFHLSMSSIIPFRWFKFFSIFLWLPLFLIFFFNYNCD